MDKLNKELLKWADGGWQLWPSEKVPDDAEKVKELLEAGATIEARINEHSMTNKFTPLMLASFSGRLNIVRLLIKSGADVNAVSDTYSDFYTALANAVLARSKPHASIYAPSSNEQRLEIVKELLQAGADPNIHNFRQTPLYELLEHFHEYDEKYGLEMVKLLLAPPKPAIPANPNLKDKNAKTALDYVLNYTLDERLAKELLVLLMKHGALTYKDLVEKEKQVKVSYTEMPQVFDIIGFEDVPILDVITSEEKSIFKIKDTYVSTDLKLITSALKDKSSTFYECAKELLSAPFRKDVNVDVPYFRIQLTGNYTVPQQELESALKSKYRVFELVPTEKNLKFVSSYASVQVTPGKNGLGRNVNIVNSHHCQAGTQQLVYTIKYVTFEKEKMPPPPPPPTAAAGGKRTRKSRKRQSHRIIYSPR